MEQITVIFQKHDGSSEQTQNILLDEPLGEYLEGVLTLLGLSDKLTYRFILMRNGKPTKELSNNQTFREAGIQQNDRLALFPLNVWQDWPDKISTSDIDPKTKTGAFQYDTPTKPTESEGKVAPSLTNLPPIIAKNWRNALIIGGLFGGVIIIGFVSTRKPVVPLLSGSISQQATSINQEQAVNLVNRWLEAKRRLFASPYDQELGAELTTGKAYKDNIRGPNSKGEPESSLEWLRNNNSYYTFSLQRIDSVERFEASGDEVVIEVIITEERTLYNSKGGVDKEASGLDTRLVRYSLRTENSKLKISEYKTLKKIR